MNEHANPRPTIARICPAPRHIHYLERDAEFLIELLRSVQVLDIVAASGRTGGGT
jgi:hypothetical protein